MKPSIEDLIPMESLKPFYIYPTKKAPAGASFVYKLFEKLFVVVDDLIAFEIRRLFHGRSVGFLSVKIGSLFI